MSDDEYYVGNKIPGRIYGSKSFEIKEQPLAEGRTERPPRRARYLDRVFPDVEGEVLAVVKHELVLRTTTTGKRQIKLYVVEDPRGIRSLVLQNFNMGDGGDTPSRNTHFSLFGQEIDDLLEIASLAREGDFQVSGKFRIGVNQLQRLDITPEAVRALVGSDTGLLENVLRNEVTEKDVVAVAYRKQQVKRFESLLRDPVYFKEEQERAAGNGAEAVWQSFFEENHWIFGGTLFLTSAGSIDSGKLERAVAGASVAGYGKRTDALLRTRGRIGALCFVEIKCHTTPLLKSTQYRPGVWAPSEQIVGAISQVQRTIQLAERTIEKSLRPTDSNGNPISDDAYLIRPRSVLICGDLEQFVTPLGVNEDKYTSFELFRRHLQGPEIVTFDELLERAKLMVETSD
ncbi:hypothetical protein ASD78_02165 [Lysobacter sp. Root667]|uniref:Shedu immune nuclease family protein n=1 Tax=Lysobacter sp. Root667 TaxID=1736581 RepID=UPI0006F6E8F6|nr:Shedu immune nuclease family protein [Lysobacter sp. Root667]KRA82091.1 hypothetical protein ASD78_02165 [Lysobacter sp. Root667]